MFEGMARTLFANINKEKWRKVYGEQKYWTRLFTYVNTTRLQYFAFFTQDLAK